MKTPIEAIEGGAITTPQGFHAGASSAGIKAAATGKPDIGILYSEEPCVAVGLLTDNLVKSAPVLLCQERLKRGRAMAVVANSGNANASTGEQGLKDAAEMAANAAWALGTEPEDVLVASTGVIGRMLPMDAVRAGIREISLSDSGGHEFARAIMTTDTFPKEAAVSVRPGDSRFAIGGAAKGSGMIHPNLGTMLGFLTTDAAAEREFLAAALRRAADVSFNMVSVDGDTSPSDTLLLLANGMAKNPPIRAGTPEADAFEQGLEHLCVSLAKSVARDGEGASKLIEVTVNGAASQSDAVAAARTIVGSPLLKAAVYGCDPNWGRVVAAVGRSGAEVVESGLDVAIGGVSVLKGGTPQVDVEASAAEALRQSEVLITVNLNLGAGSATAWGCDLTEEYVVINSQYTT